MELLRKIERYLVRNGIAPTRFGRDVAGDPNLIRELRNGRAPGADMVGRIRATMEAR